MDTLRLPVLPLCRPPTYKPAFAAPQGYKRIVAAYGDAILREDGEIDRAKLGAVVFKDPTARKKLNQAAHPPVLGTHSCPTSARCR